MGYEILYYGGSDSVVIADSASNDDVAEVFHNERHSVSQSPEHALATARLFVAAPDLLAAMRAAIEIICDSYGEEQLSNGDDQAVNVLLSAIARAEGR